MRWILAFILAGIFFFGGFLFFRLGLYRTAEVHGIENQTLQLIYVEHKGAYYKIVDSIKKVESWAFQNNVECSRTYGEYLDDPSQIDEARLRSHGGCVVSVKPANPLPEGFNYEEKAANNYLHVEFDGAPSVGPWKVYPKANDWMSENHYKINGPVIEIYQIVGKDKVITHYYFPVKQ